MRDAMVYRQRRLVGILCELQHRHRRRPHAHAGQGQGAPQGRGRQLERFLCRRTFRDRRRRRGLAGERLWGSAGAAQRINRPVQRFQRFKGTGSYFGGFQAGYNYLLPSGLALGVETDISFANTISGTALMAAPSIGQASSTDNVQMFGTLRGRAGIVRDNWASQKSDMHRLTRRRRTYAILSIEQKTGLERPSIQNHEICLVGRECSAPK